MHPLIAFLSFLFSPSDDWLLKQAYQLMIDPSQMPAAVEQVETIAKQYPSTAGNLSADATVTALWADILNSNGLKKEAANAWKKLAADASTPDDIREEARLKRGEALMAQGSLDEAEPLFLKILESPGTPRALDARVDLLVCALEKNDVAGAAAIAVDIQNNFEIHASHGRALFPLGLSAYAAGRLEEAGKYFEEMGDDPRGRYYLGLTLKKQGRTHEALVAWQTIRRAGAERFWLDLTDFQLAETYFALGDDRLCRAVCEKSMAASPENPNAGKLAFRLASLDFRAKNYDGALTRLAALSNADVGSRTVALKAEALIKTGRSGDLSREMARANQGKSNVETAYQTAWAALFENRRDESVALAEHGLEKFYDADFTPRLLLLQGLAYEHLGREAEALAAYQTIADRFPGSTAAAHAAHWTTLAYMRVNRPYEAVTHGAYLWNKLSEDVRRAEPDTAFWLGEAHLKLNRAEDAEENYRQFLAMAPADHPLLANGQFQRSVALARLNRKEDALALLDSFSKTSAERKKPEWVKLAQLQRGHIFFNNKNYVAAVVAYRAAGDTPKSLFHEGLALYRMDYFSDATATWTKLAAQFPMDPYAENAAFRAARTQFELGLTTQAVTAFTQFVKTFPQSPLVKEARLQSAHALYNAGDAAAAAPLYAEYLARASEPEDVAAVTPYLASCYVRLGKSAEETAARMKGLPPTEELASLRWQDGATLYNEKNFAGADRQFALLLAEIPTQENASNALFYRGEGLFQRQQWRDAEMVLNCYLKSDADSARPHETLAMFHKSVALYNQDKLLKAAQAFEAFIARHPDDVLSYDAKQNVALCYHNLGDFATRDAVRERYHLPTDPAASTPPVERPATERNLAEVPVGTAPAASFEPQELGLVGRATESPLGRQ